MAHLLAAVRSCSLRQGGLRSLRTASLLTVRSLQCSASRLAEYEVLQMPALSPTMEAGTISSWSVKPGEGYEAGAILCEVETDKATVSYEMQDEGVLAKILVEAGAGEVGVGLPIAVICEDDAAYAAFAAEDALGNIVLPAAGASAAAVEAPAAEAPTAAAAATAPATAANVTGRTVALEFLLMPAARHLAESKGIDVSGLAGSAHGGRITKGDVLVALKAGTSFPPLPTARDDHVAATAAPAAAVVAGPNGEVEAGHRDQANPAALIAAATGSFDLSSVAVTDAPFEDVPASGMRKVIAKRLDALDDYSSSKTHRRPGTMDW